METSRPNNAAAVKRSQPPVMSERLRFAGAVPWINCASVVARLENKIQEVRRYPPPHAEHLTLTEEFEQADSKLENLAAAHLVFQFHGIAQELIRFLGARRGRLTTKDNRPWGQAEGAEKY